MSAEFVAVRLTLRKLIYDAIALVAVTAWIGGLVLFGGSDRGTGAVPLTDIRWIRATGSAALLLLSFLLCIGPLARCHPWFHGWLWNRRHLGVIAAMLGVWHAKLVLDVYYAWDATGLSRLQALFSYDQIGVRGVPSFVWYGLFALLGMLILAASSHDFWQRYLGGRFWKWLHMLTYPVYASVLLHVALGVGQSEPFWFWLASGLGALVFGLHGVLAIRELRQDRRSGPIQVIDGEPFVHVGPLSSFVEGRPQSVLPRSGERIAVVLHAGRVHGLTAVCPHQGGPLDEGLVIDGCLTCPWHGWQYRPEDGSSPPPYEERIATHPIVVRDDQVYVREEPCRPEGLRAAVKRTHAAGEPS